MKNCLKLLFFIHAKVPAMIIWQSMDDLKHKLFYTNLELQNMKVKADVTMRKHKDIVQHLLNLLANAYKERDEARDQLQKLIDKSMY